MVGPTVVVVSSVHDGMLSLTHLTEPFKHILKWKKKHRSLGSESGYLAIKYLNLDGSGLGSDRRLFSIMSMTLGIHLINLYCYSTTGDTSINNVK